MARGISLLRSRAEAAPFDRDARDTLARALAATGDFEGARRELERLGGATEPDVEIRIAETLAAEGKFAEAIPRLERVVAAAPDLARPRHDLGVARWRAGDAGRGLADLEAAAAIDPLDPEAQATLAVAWTALGRPDRAETHRRRLARLDPVAAARLAP
jgi:Flp pilus assembly protein TadD